MDGHRDTGPQDLRVGCGPGCDWKQQVLDTELEHPPLASIFQLLHSARRTYRRRSRLDWLRTSANSEAMRPATWSITPWLPLGALASSIVPAAWLLQHAFLDLYTHDDWAPVAHRHVCQLVGLWYRRSDLDARRVQHFITLAWRTFHGRSSTVLAAFRTRHGSYWIGCSRDHCRVDTRKTGIPARP